MNHLSVRSTLRFAWDTFKKRPLMIIGGYVLAMVISIITSTFLDTQGMDPLDAVAILMSLAGIVIGLLIEMGIVTFALRAHDSISSVRVQDLWNPKPFWRYLGGQILVGAIVLAGLIMLVIPGIIAALALFATSYLIIDRGLGPIAAIKESYRITKGHWLKLFLLVVAIVSLNIIGLLALVVGLLVTIPISMLAMVHAYRTLAGHGEHAIRNTEESITVS